MILKLLFITAISVSALAHAQNARDAATVRYVQKFKDGLKQEARCESFKQRFDATLDKGTMAQGVFMTAFMKEYEAAKADKCVIPTPVNGLKD